MIEKTSKLVHYADEIMIYTSNGNIEEAISILENEIDKLIHLFQCHSLTVNANKTEFVTFCKHWKKQSDPKLYLTCEN